jgi:hypothetical protein
VENDIYINRHEYFVDRYFVDGEPITIHNQSEREELKEIYDFFENESFEGYSQNYNDKAINNIEVLLVIMQYNNIGFKKDYSKLIAIIGIIIFAIIVDLLVSAVFN